MRITSWFPQQQAATCLPAPSLSLSPMFSLSLLLRLSLHLIPLFIQSSSRLLPLSPFKSPSRHKVFFWCQLLCMCLHVLGVLQSNSSCVLNFLLFISPSISKLCIRCHNNNCNEEERDEACGSVQTFCLPSFCLYLLFRKMVEGICF